MEQPNPIQKRNPISAVFSPSLSIALGVSLSIPLCLAAYWSIRLAAADHLSRADSLPSVQRSTRLAPGNVRYLLRLAEWEAAEGRDASLPLRQAVQASPLNSSVWIQLGLQAEQKGDMAAAGEALLRAARLDRQFRPRWELASFYVRRNDPRRSWRWAREALQIGPPGDYPAVFRLCWSVDAGAADIAKADISKAIWREAIPQTPVVTESYLGFLLAANKLDAAAPVAAQLVEVAQASQAPSLLWFCDAAIAAPAGAGFADAALSCWNRMSRRGLLPYPALDPSAGKSLINGNFERAPSGRGFDWRLANIAGISVNYDETSPHLRMEFSGKQPESCEPLITWVALEPRRKYRLSCRYETAGIPPGSGLKWRLSSAANGVPILPEVPLGNAPLGAAPLAGGPATAMEFRAPEGAQNGPQLWRLALVYQRAPGTVRIEGSVRLVDVSLELDSLDFAP